MGGWSGVVGKPAARSRPPCCDPRRAHARPPNSRTCRAFACCCSFLQYIEALERCSMDGLEFVKDKAVKALFELLW